MMHSTRQDKSYIPVSVRSLCLATQQQKLLSSSRFDVFQAKYPDGILLRRSVFFTDTGKNPPTGPNNHQGVYCTACGDSVRETAWIASGRGAERHGPSVRSSYIIICIIIIIATTLLLLLLLLLYLLSLLLLLVLASGKRQGTSFQMASGNKQS